MKTLTIIAVTSGGASLARRLGEQLPEAVVWLPEKLRRQDGCCYFDAPMGELLPQLFGETRGLVCIMATGIVVRLLAPHLRGKELDPAVVVADEAGRFAISLLGGHLGGANELAQRVAEACGGQAVITTATDVNGLPAWDDVARRENLAVEPLANVKLLNGLLLEGRPIGLVDRKGRVAGYFEDLPGVRRARNFADPLLGAAEGKVFVTHRHIPEPQREPSLLLLHPRDLVVGIGCNRGTSAEEIAAAVQDVLTKAFLSPLSLSRVASVEAKRDETGLLEYAEAQRLPIDFYPPAALNVVPVASAPSAHARQAVGASGVCEPAARLSAGGGPLLVAKQKRGNVTVAVAEKI